MNQIEDNKALVLNFFKTISGKDKSKDIIKEFSLDTYLSGHILYFESLIPSFKILIDEIIAEGSKVCVKARYSGIQKGKINGNDPTYKEIEFPLVICYRISYHKIIDHWIIGDQMTLLKQLSMV